MTTVIIPTLAIRPAQLDRAISSVNAQRGPRAIALVVVNGNRMIPDYFASLKRRSDIRLIRTPVGGVSHARLLGLKCVDSTLFAFLDDDDELLPEATAVRSPGLIHDTADMIATNGWRNHDNSVRQMFDYEKSSDDPARDLLESNWMHSAGASYSTSRVAPSFFEGVGDLMEITRFTLRISLALRVSRIDVPTFVVHEDAEARASMSREYLYAIPSVLADMRSETKRTDIQRTLARLRTAALHECSDHALHAGDVSSAFRFHLSSLAGPGGLRYLAYSRHICSAALGRR